MVQDSVRSSGTGRRSLVVRAGRMLWRLLAHGTEREMLWLRWGKSKAVFQPYNETSRNRYPRIFRFVQSALGREGEHRILSFGCSTGEEVFSLRRYFPKAFLKGIDINAANIAVCRKRLKRARDERISFAVADGTQAEPAGAYDAIFCMAVLKHGDLKKPDVTRCDHLLPFETFAAAVADMARCLKPGGLLVIRHSNFRLRDAPAGKAFETIFRAPNPNPEATPIFGPDNARMPGVHYRDAVFRKMPSRPQASAP